MGWGHPSRFARQSPTQGAESGAGSGCRREAGACHHRARTHGRNPDFRSETLLAFLKENVALGSTVYTDGLKSFTGLKEAGFQHVPRSQPLRIDLRKGAKSVVPLADRAIGNLQQWLLGTHHGVSRDQLQAYLHEFVFRHNRRKTPMAAFQTLLGLGTEHKPTKYEEIRGASDLGEPPAEG
jgi:transposase-like protein